MRIAFEKLILWAHDHIFEIRSLICQWIPFIIVILNHCFRDHCSCWIISCHLRMILYLIHCWCDERVKLILLLLNLHQIVFCHHLIDQLQLFHFFIFLIFNSFLLFFLFSFFFLILPRFFIFTIVEYFIVETLTVKTANYFFIFCLIKRLNFVFFRTWILTQYFRNGRPFLLTVLIHFTFILLIHCCLLFPDLFL